MGQIEAIIENDGLDPKMLATRAKQWKAKRATAFFAKMFASNYESQQDLAICVLAELHLSYETSKLLDDLICAIEAMRFKQLPYRLQAAILWPAVFEDFVTLARWATNHAFFRSAS